MTVPAPSGVTVDAGHGEHPGRVFIVSADMGEGHNATARALAERVRQLWPRCDVRTVDTLQVMGRGVGPVFRRIYVTNVRSTPWLYEFFYSSLHRHRWFAVASKWFVGAWCGRRLAPRLERYHPDLILSTFPLGSAGLDWLRRRGRLGAPTGAWISDFAPHPFWVYEHLDAHLVMHELAVPLATRAVPGAPVAVSAPPVVSQFRPRDRDRQRCQLGLDPKAFVALVSCGAFGFGTVDSAVHALLSAHQRVQVVVACGHNDALRRRLQAHGLPAHRLRPLGWERDMPAWTAAADIVVTNAGGATALEALASHRAIVMFDPIAAHGRANAELLAAAGLALLCRRATELTVLVRRLVDDPGSVARLEAAAAAHVSGHDLNRGLLDLAALRGRSRRPQRQRLRAQDAFFLHVDTPRVAQQVGAVLVLDPSPAAGAPTLAQLRSEVAARLPGLPTLRRRPVGGTRWRRPRWLVEEDLDIRAHVDEVSLACSDGGRYDVAVDEFFSTPLDRRRPLWQLRLIRVPGGRSVVAVKVHHSLGDGLSVVGTLSGLLDPRPAALSGDDSAGKPAAPADRRSWHDLARLLRGLRQLIRGGTAPASPLNAALPGCRRHIVTTSLPVAEVRLLARRHRVSTSEVAVWVVAAALHRVLDQRHPPVTVLRLRAMIPVSLGRSRRTWGNWTGGLPVELTLGPMLEEDRLALVSAEMRRQSERGTAHAGAAVVRLLGLFPQPVHARLARLVYRDRWFNLIVSFLPGAPSARRLAGVRLAETYPVLPLAEGIGLSIGLMSWDGALGVGITADPGLVPDADRLGPAMQEAVRDLAAATAAQR